MKLHKSPPSSRPIAASTTWLATPAATWLNRELQCLVALHTCIAVSTSAVANRLQQLRLPANARMSSLDVESLYPSIDVNELRMIIAIGLRIHS